VSYLLNTFASNVTSLTPKFKSSIATTNKKKIIKTIAIDVKINKMEFIEMNLTINK
jgi:hypothetical protein